MTAWTPRRYPEAPGYKARKTSLDAARGMTERAPKLRDRIFDSLKTEGPATPEIIAERLGEPLMNVRPRLSELAKLGLVFDTGRRGEAQGGRRAIVWGAGLTAYPQEQRP